MKTILVDALETFSYEDGTIFGDLHKLLETFPNQKILVSGANDEQANLWKLDTMPYEVFTLKHTPEKTDPQYFQTLLQHYGLTKDDVVYFEHNPKAVASATSLGITSYFYNPEKKDLVALKEFLDENLG